MLAGQVGPGEMALLAKRIGEGRSILDAYVVMALIHV
jgi:hypothetical protein